uniref:Secreted protein n=1 Tax=Ascaris lumbricoides TaxID=6252 RepID=A0A0M3HVZ3_ASCLU
MLPANPSGPRACCLISCTACNASLQSPTNRVYLEQKVENDTDKKSGMKSSEKFSELNTLKGVSCYIIRVR